VAGADLAATQFRGPLAERLRFESLVYRQSGEIVEIIDPLVHLEIELCGVAVQSVPALDLKVSFFRDGVLLASVHDTEREAPMREGKFVSRLVIPPDVFRPGRYMLGVGATAGIG